MSAVVFRIAVGLIDIKGMKNIFLYKQSEFWVALITTITVVVIGVEQGIILAMVLSLSEHTRHGYHPKNLLIRPSPDSNVLQTKPLTTALQAEPELVIYRFTHSIYYANTQQLTDEITTLVNDADPALKWLCLDASVIDSIDFTAAESLRAIFIMLKEKGVRFVVSQMMDDVNIENQDLIDELFGENAYYDTLDDVVNAY